MKNPRLFSLFAGIALAGASLTGQSVTVTIEGFGDPTSFTNLDASLQLRVAELIPAPGGVNNSTHVLVEGLSPVDPGTMNYASPYSGINVSNGEVQDMGMLYLVMPSGSELPEGTVASPIVGVVQRAGPWSDYTLQYPATDLGGAAGTGELASGTLSMELNKDTSTFLGSTSYTMPDADTVEMDGFTLTQDGGTSYTLSAATLKRDGDRFYGTLTSEPYDYNSLIYAIELVGMGGGISLTEGAWTDGPAGHVYGFSGDIGYGINLGFFLLGEGNWIYLMPYGWSHLAHTTAGGGMYLYNLDANEWLYTENGWHRAMWVVGSDPAVWK
ncbi:MAG: hypothetical protein ACP5I4_07280 [Oceanipulchritudo sp.]